MGKTEKPAARAPRLFRIIAMAMAWSMWLFVTLACLSFHPNDATNLPGSPIYYGQPAPVRNWCGAIGAKVSFLLFYNVGPGSLVALAMIAAMLVVWTRGKDVTQLVLRLLGGTLLIAAVSAAFNMAALGGRLPEGPGGLLGIAVGSFLVQRFSYVGSGLILLFAVMVGLLLAADEFVLALPAVFFKTWKKVPAGELAEAAGGAATGAANGIVQAFKNVADRFISRNSRMGARAKPARTGTPRKPKTAVVTGPLDDAAMPGAVASIPTSAISRAAVIPLDDDEDDDAIAPALPAPAAVAEVVVAPSVEPVVRKPAMAKMLPLKPAAPPPQDLGNYQLPPLDLLEEPEPVNVEGQEQRVREKARVLEGALTSFGIDGKVVAIDTGPVVTLYELELAPGVKSSQVAALAKDIARALMSPPVRMIDNIPGKSTMGIEVPNIDKEKVRLKELMQLGQNDMARMALPMCLGKDASGNPLIEDLARMPHLLIAGTTGSGKSVCINSIIMTLLLTQRPDHVKLIMVDPKMVEMQDYKQIPHLMAPIIDDMTKAESILEWATQKMDERYETLSEAGVRHVKDFNKLTREQILERFQPSTPDEEARIPFHMPYIVIIIDELADLMMTSKEVEGHIVRIAQKARAVGIHLILATQRPEAQVVTGLIKSNMPGRLCFQVRSRLDSRIMLDQSGGELLLGQGDMLMLRPTGGGLLRGQGAFVEDAEIKGICRFLKDIAQPEFHPELLQLGAPAGLADAEKDELFDDAVKIIIETKRGSVSLLQRRLTIGYSRASRLIDQMRAAGIVGAYKGSQASEVLMTLEDWEALQMAQARDKAEGIGEDPPVPVGVASSGGDMDDDSAEDEDDGVPDEMPGEHRG